MRPLIMLVVEICDKEEKVDPLFLFFHKSNLPTYRDGSHFILLTKTLRVQIWDW